MDNFLCTRTDGIYSIFTAACKKNLEKKIKNKLNIIKIKKQFPSSSYIIFILREFFLFNLSRSRLINLKYKEIRLGRYIFPSILQNYNSYFNFTSYYFELAKRLYQAGKIINFLELNENVRGAYVDHGIYLNGIIIEFFLKKKKIVYSDNYPRTLFCIENSRSLDYEDLLKINKKKDTFYKKRKNFLHKAKIFSNPNILPWMKNVNFKKIEKKTNYTKYDYVIYAHSFTDAQMTFGYDGFINVYEWLIFTIDYLRKKNKKIIIKAHPNFYISNKKKEFVDPLSFNDNLIYRKIIKKYESDKDILFINKALSNIEFLKLLDNNKHILISHHGTSILENAYFKFKCISSIACPWEKKFNVTNYFSNIKNYKVLLDKPLKKLKKANLRDLKKLVYELYFGDFTLFGKKSYYYFLKRNLKFTEPINRKNRDKLLNKLKKMKKEKYKLIFDLSKNIESIS